jgi:hypothetical protein
MARVPVNPASGILAARRTVVDGVYPGENDSRCELPVLPQPVRVGGEPLVTASSGVAGTAAPFSVAEDAAAAQDPRARPAVNEPRPAGPAVNPPITSRDGGPVCRGNRW